MPTTASFMDAFKQASALYEESIENKVATAIQNLGSYPSEKQLKKKFKSDLYKLILEHRLGMFLFVSSWLAIYHLHSAQLKCQFHSPSLILEKEFPFLLNLL